MNQQGLVSLIASALLLGCSAGGTSRGLVVGSEGTGGGTGGPQGNGGNSLVLVGDGSTPTALSAHVESPPGITVEVITLSCSNACAEVVAVAKGGFAPYSYTWEDGSTDASRHVCPTATTSYRVTVTDTGSAAGEFRRDPETATAPLTANVLRCTLPGFDAGPGGSGGSTGQEGGAGSTLVYWTNWATVAPGTPGTASGTIPLPEGDVQVAYGGELGPNSETETGVTNNWAPASTYTSTRVQAGPPNAGILALSGGATLTQTITFSVPVQDPVIAIWSVGFGSLGIASTWTFDTAPTLLSSGPSTSWPFSAPPTLSGNSMTATEGNGVLELTGTFTSVSFTIPTPEPAPGYGGFTVGIRGRR